MPQFDKITFFNQIFWLLLMFSVFYILLLRNYLPKIALILKVRRKKLSRGASFMEDALTENSKIFVDSNNIASALTINSSNQIEKHKELNFSNLDSFSESLQITSGTVSTYYSYYSNIAIKKWLTRL